MSDPIDHPRRAFIATTAASLALARWGAASAAQATPSTTNRDSGALSAFRSLKRIKAGALEVEYAEQGPPAGQPVLLLHGWPYDIHTYVEVAPVLAEAGYRVIVPHLRGYGGTRFLSADTPRNGQQAALAFDAIALLDALQVREAIVGGCDWGARTANIVAALWPQRCKGLVSVSGYLIGSQEANRAPLPPQAELQWWYQYYFTTERGEAGYRKYTREFARLIWTLASPRWSFDEATFARSAAAFDNPDHVAIVIHNYRWRLGLGTSDSQYASAEKTLATLPGLLTPTITLEGDANGAPHPEPSAYAKSSPGPYEHRLITGGVGHNLPQEAPEALCHGHSRRGQAGSQRPARGNAMKQKHPSQALHPGTRGRARPL